MARLIAWFKKARSLRPGLLNQTGSAYGRMWDGVTVAASEQVGLTPTVASI
jgi:hypothetical protein